MQNVVFGIVGGLGIILGIVLLRDNNLKVDYK